MREQTTINTALLPVKESKEISSAIKILVFASSGFWSAAHLITNGRLLTALEAEGAAASTLISTIQPVILGIGVGFLAPTGMYYAKAMGENKPRKAGDIAKTSFLLTGAAGIMMGSSMLITTQYIFPNFYTARASTIAAEFVYPYAIALTPILFVITESQLPFTAGDWYIPPLCMFSIFSISGISSYLLGFQTKLGALGIGLGGLIGSMTTALWLTAWLSRKNYQQNHLFQLKIDDFRVNTKTILTAGWKMALQRLTEWGNLFIITNILGIQEQENLVALNPSMLYLVLFIAILQNFAQAANMTISHNKGIIKQAKDSNDENTEIIILSHHQKNIKSIFQSIFLATTFNSMIAIIAYFARRPLTQLLLPNDNSRHNTQEFSEKLLWLNLLGLIPDATRTVGAGILRSWKNFLYPVIISFIWMTAIGIPTAYGLGEALNNETEIMVYIRNITMLLSSAFILKRTYNCIKEDENLLSDSTDKPSFWQTGLDGLA